MLSFTPGRKWFNEIRNSRNLARGSQAVTVFGSAFISPWARGDMLPPQNIQQRQNKYRDRHRDRVRDKNSNIIFFIICIFNCITLIYQTNFSTQKKYKMYYLKSSLFDLDLGSRHMLVSANTILGYNFSIID